VYGKVYIKNVFDLYSLFLYRTPMSTYIEEIGKYIESIENRLARSPTRGNGELYGNWLTVVTEVYGNWRCGKCNTMNSKSNTFSKEQ
jgi:hypothetical protein